MSRFFDKFPLVRYTLNKQLYSEYDITTNLLFRIGIIRDVMENNINAYYYYAIVDGDRPEIVAEKVYGDAEAHWIILYANNIYDPYYDWPMDSRTFDKYITDKYGSIAWAQTNYHHYEKVITRENPAAQVTMVTSFEVNDKKLTNDVLSLIDYEIDYNIGEPVFIGASYGANTYSGTVMAWSNSNGYIVLANTTGAARSYDFLIGANSAANGTVISTTVPSVPMDAYNTLVDTTDYASYEVGGSTVREIISRNRVTYYDYELELNESKRLIKIIQPQYYNQIISELDNLTGRRVIYRKP
jgi:hypothetical protein